MQVILNGQCVAGIDTPGLDAARQINPRVVGFTIHCATANAITKGIDSGDAAIRIHIAKLRRLPKTDTAGVNRRARHKAVALTTEFAQRRHLP